MKLLHSLVRPGKSKAKKPRMRSFDFQCVGVQKSGTTWLWQNCVDHPEICVPPVKEVQYFSYEHLGVYYKNLARKHANSALKRAARLRDKDRHELAEIYEEIADGCDHPTEEWYRKVFSVFPDNVVAGEFTPDYFCVGLKGVRHIHEMNSEARIIIFIRDPRSRIISSLNMALRNDHHLDQRKIVAGRMFLERGNYLKHVRIWDQVFGENVLYVPFREIAEEPERTMRLIETHIGASHFDGYTSLSVRSNSWSGAFEIDQAVLDGLSDHIKEQTEYLSQRFGRSFCAKI